MTAPRAWQIWIDTGGTFTDAIAEDPEGRVHRAKVLSSGALRGTVEELLAPNRLRVSVSWKAPRGFLRGFGFRLLEATHPGGTVVDDDPASSTLELSDDVPAEPGATFEVSSPESAPVLAARLITATPSDQPLAPSAMRLATTLGTNALLERRGVATALFITRGFGDLLRIGTQERPDLFALDVTRPEPLYRSVVEVPGRLAADGSEVVPLDAGTVAGEARKLSARGVRVAAVALAHSYANPAHEKEVERILLRCGFEHVSRSSDLAPMIRLLPRAETAVVDAYLSRAIEDHLEGVRSRLSGGRLHVMTSAGGLVDSTAFRPADSLLSGPAGGVVGAAAAGRRSGFGSVIAFDMGGTSTDVARFDGDFEYTFEHRVGDARLVAPALAIESVAAGGGSICWFDGDRMRVGPESAGARPGPACYGDGGPLTLTDVNVLSNRLDPTRFGIPVSPDAARRAFERLGPLASDEPESVLRGFLDIANERMADAIREVSIRRGHDPAGFTLVAFGGAGGQHACAVAERLGIDTVLVPRDAGLLSAVGLGAAVIERFAERQVLRRLDGLGSDLPHLLDELSHEARQAVAAQGVASEEIEVRRRIAHLRFVGQDSVVEVDDDGETPLADAFEERYRALFGHRPEGRDIELESLRVVASTRPGPAPSSPEPAAGSHGAESVGVLGAMRVYDRERLSAGSRVDGPALVFERHGTTVIEDGWRGEVDAASGLVLRRLKAAPTRRRAEPEAARLELFTNRFGAIAKEMGERLRRTAVSTNVKERLDFSCALLDPCGSLVVNAPHVPVHLGALGLCVRRVRESLPLSPGDVVVTNHPAWGGSHLPDITVVTPVFSEGDDLLGFVASRAHHAEIGGSRPGSMPPGATSLAEEGVVLPPTHVVKKNEPRWEAIRSLLESPPWPSRAVEDNLADLRAAVAANHAGATALRELSATHGAATVLDYMRALETLSEKRMRDALSRTPDGEYNAVERLDDGSPLRVRLVVRGDEAVVDFAGSAGVHAGNLNAPMAIVHSAVIYFLRLLIKEPVPLNEGFLRPVTMRVPAGILNPSFPENASLAPAVVGGNVETSQRLVDLLLKALGIVACSQGTMNNVLFGDDRTSYYETVCGGCGAGPGWDGADAVHSHMTNTRITDPEVLEHRYPVRLEKFAIRRGSGGAGRFRGGDGVLREITFLAPMSLSVLGQHRVERPFGLEGGQPGRRGSQRVVRATGEVVELRPIDACEVGEGDRFVLATPGGGGFGSGTTGSS